MNQKLYKKTFINLSRYIGRILLFILITSQMALAVNSGDVVEIIQIKNGTNYIDLNGDGRKDMVISGHRSHITTHRFQAYTIYIYRPEYKVENKSYKWHIVAISDDPKDVSKETYSIFTKEGADCVLRDIRFVRLKGESLPFLVVAERLFTSKDTYASRNFVIFKFYKLFLDDVEDRYVYKKTCELKSKKKYCDVNKAFLEELKN
uniref:VCBS repeat-containing protein n=1 Tax=Hydrogenobacter sp. TaxID=2152829 RepID=A0A7C2V6F9_9AQUI